MTASELALIESALGLALPASYRQVMLVYPLDPTGVNSQIALLKDASAVIAFNRFLREQFPNEWQRSFFAVGNSPSGDPYFLDLSGTSPVWSWDHETHDIAQEAPTFATWLAIQKALESRSNN